MPIDKISRFEGEYRFLSNFYPCDITYHGIVYPSTEHAFQAQKTLSQAERQAIAAASTPAIAKKMGRKCTLRPEWDAIKDAVMLDLLSVKFWHHEDLRIKLVATGDAYLEEGNWWGDTYWGVCKGKGHNRLGQLLMQVRKVFNES